MPILKIEIIGEPDVYDRKDLARNIADSIGQALNAGPQDVWVRISVISPSDYAENNGDVEYLPVFASVLKMENPEIEELKKEIDKITNCIAESCNRPKENVHVSYDLPAKERQAFGGELQVD